MPRPSNTAARQAEIVQGLLRVIGSLGYERASVAAIAEAAGLSAGLIHYHFRSKQEILLALLEHLATSFAERLRARLEATGPDPRARLHAFIDAHLARDAHADPQAVAAWVTICVEALRQPAVASAYRLVMERRFALLHELVRDASRASSGHARDAKQLAAAILAGIEGAYQLSAAAPELLPTGYASPSMRRMVDAVLEPRARSRRSRGS